MKKVAILMGGDSSERVISLKSADVVYESLKDKYNCVKVDISSKGWLADVAGKTTSINKNDFSLNGEIFDLAFIAIHGSPGENGQMQSYLEMLQIPFTTCSSFLSALTFNKAACNAFLAHQGFKVAKSVHIRKGDELKTDEIIKKLGLPMFVKPNAAGSSFGVSMVEKAEGISNALAFAFKEDKLALIESFLPGIEIGCGVHNLNGPVEALPLTEIRTGNKFFDFQAKYEGASNEITPAEISTEATHLVQELGISIYKSLALNGLCRMDFKLHEGIPTLIEVNTVPGFSKESIIPKQAEAAGMSTTELFSKMVEAAL